MERTKLRKNTTAEQHEAHEGVVAFARHALPSFEDRSPRGRGVHCPASRTVHRGCVGYWPRAPRAARVGGQRGGQGSVTRSPPQTPLSPPSRRPHFFSMPKGFHLCEDPPQSSMTPSNSSSSAHPTTLGHHAFGAAEVASRPSPPSYRDATASSSVLQLVTDDPDAKVFLDEPAPPIIAAWGRRSGGPRNLDIKVSVD